VLQEVLSTIKYLLDFEGRGKTYGDHRAVWRKEGGGKNKQEGVVIGNTVRTKVEGTSSKLPNALSLRA